GTGPYDILWTNGNPETNIAAGTDVITGLVANTYGVTVTDANGCEGTAEVTLSPPTAVNVSISSWTPVECKDESNGTGTVTFSGGTANYNILWSAGTGTTASNVGAGTHTVTGLSSNTTYSVTVTDSKSCIATDEVSPTANPLSLNVSAVGADPQCNNGTDGTGTVTFSGGPIGSDFDIVWNAGTGPTTTANAPGSHTVTDLSFNTTYTVTVTDDNNCVVTQEITLGNPTIVSATVASFDNPTCTGDNDGSITITPGGGDGGPYTYLWDNAGASTTNPLTGLTGTTTYNVTVKDGNNCEILTSQLITDPTIVGATIAETDVLCFGASTGAADLTPTGGSGAYTYVWNPFANTQDLTGLATGTYSVTVNDGNCTAETDVFINQPAADITFNTLITNSDCSASNGAACVDVGTEAGGNGAPYTYVWSSPNNPIDECTGGVPAGTYTVTVIDQFSCEVTATVDVSDAAAPNVVINSYTDTLDCNGICTGQVEITITGGDGNYTVDWDDGAINDEVLVGSGAISTATLLCAGPISVEVTDGASCVGTANTTIYEYDVLTANLSGVITHPKCVGSADGIATVAGGGGNAPYTYDWGTAPNQTTAQATGLEDGTYTVTVTDDNGCEETVDVILIDPIAVTAVVASSEDPTCDGLSNGSITVTPGGGTGVYTYTWDNGAPATNPTTTLGGTTTYNVTVYDENLCTATTSQLITNPAAVIVTITDFTDPTCIATGDVTVTAGGGDLSYTYTWLPASGTANVAANLTAGTYTVEVEDGKGCTVSATQILNDPPSVTATIGTPDNPACNGDANGSAIVTITGGTANYNVNWSDVTSNNESGIAVTTSTASDLLGGVKYVVTVTDSKGCTDTDDITLTDPDLIGATIFGLVDPKCNGGTDGEMSVSPSGGNGVYTYAWNAGDATTSATNTGLSATTYTVVVTDGESCFISVEGTLFENLALATTISGVNPLCPAAFNGTVDLGVTGGTGAGTYDYFWQPNGDLGQDLSLKDARTYTVLVTDDNDCTTSTEIDLIDPPALTGTTAPTYIYCGQTNGQIIAAGVAGTEGTGYTYLWSSNASDQTVATAINLGADMYTVTITDGNGCIITYEETIDDLDGVTASASALSNPDCPTTCTEGSVTASGDINGGWTYLWDDDLNQTTQVATGLIAELSPGTEYCVTITDIRGCEDNVCVTLEAEPSMIFIITPTHLTCNGNGTGEIDLAYVSGGNHTGASPASPDWTYVWSPAVPGYLGGTGLDAGTYSVTITDALGEFVVYSTTITEPDPLLATATGNDPNCNLATDGDATVEFEGGTAPYDIDWTNNSYVEAAEGTNTESGLGNGTHGVTVTDDNGCEVITSTTITEPALLTAIISGLTDPKCFEATDGEAIVTINNGTADYAINWDDGTANDVTGHAGGTHTATNLGDGAICVEVTDSKGCIANDCKTLTEPTELTVTVTDNTPPTCNGEGDATATITIAGGTSLYDVKWGGDNTNDDLIAGPTHTATNLNGGQLYTATVTDNNGCIANATITPTDPMLVTIDASGNNPACFEYNNGDATATSGGGTGTLVYEWDGGSTNATINTLIAGTYTVTVTDDEDCEASIEVILTDPLELTISTGSLSSTCGQADGSAFITEVTNFIGDTIIAWDVTANSQSTITAHALTNGSYSVTVTDGNSCSVVTAQGVSDDTGPIVKLSSQVDVTCFGLTNGSINIVINDGSPTYSISIDPLPTGLTNPIESGVNSGDTKTISGLSAMFYSLTIIDATGCIVIDDMTIIEPDLLTAEITTTHPSCFEGTNGTATATPTGGNAIDTYTWTPTLNGLAAETNLADNTYTVVIEDVKGCTATAEGFVTEPAELTARISDDNNPLCNSAVNGDATVEFGGGTTDYTVDWGTGPALTTNLLTDQETAMAAGTYTVTITDDNDCVVTAEVTLNDPDVVVASISDFEDVSCFGTCDGSATAAGTGGTGLYTYLWDNAATTAAISDLCAGIYNVTATDGNGCAAITSVTIDAPLALGLTTTPTDVTCFGELDGAIDLAVTGGTDPIEYSWSSVTTDQNITALAAGDYTVTATDDKGCTLSVTETITQPAEILLTTTVINKSTCQQNDGNGSVTVTQGDASTGWTYLWSGGEAPINTSLLVNVFAGRYDVEVTSNNTGCSVTTTLDITDDQSPIVNIIDTDSVTCFGFNDGVAVGQVTSGTPDYYPQWYSGPDLINDIMVGETGLSINVLYADINYTLEIIDESGCKVYTTVTVGEPTEVKANINPSTDALCAGSLDGTATVVSTGGTGVHSYQWTPNSGETTEFATGLATGNYIVSVSDENGCAVTDTVFIYEPALIVVTAVETEPSLCGSFTGAATASATGGDGDYTYLWSNGEPVQTTINGLTNAQYFVEVTDDNGCTGIGIVTITEKAGPQIIVSDFDKPSCVGECDGEAQVSSPDGLAPFIYDWSTGSSDARTAGLCAGQTYTVTLTDANGCEDTEEFDIVDPDPIGIDLFSDTPLACFGDCTGEVIASGTGGTGAFTYVWDANGDLGYSLVYIAKNLCAGDYTVTVTDAKGCSISAEGDVVAPEEIAMSVFSIETASCGNNDGVASVTASGGTNLFTFKWSSGGTFAKEDSLVAESYTVTATDENGCEGELTVDIPDADGPSVDLVLIDSVSCFEKCDGRLEVVGMAGLKAQGLNDLVFTYEWTSNGTEVVGTTALKVALCAGPVSVKLTDATGCVVSYSNEIFEPVVLTSNVAITDISCSNGDDGTATVYGIGGTGDYTYSWDTPSTNQTITDLSPGTYDVLVTDENGCAVTDNAILGNPASLSGYVTTTDVECNGIPSGTAIFTFTGGDEGDPDEYEWSNGQTGSGSFSLASGTHTVTVTTEKGCEGIFSGSLIEPLPVVAIITSAEQPLCFNDETGGACVSAQGGTAATGIYNYSWNKYTGNSSCATGVIGGVVPLKVTVTDDNGCMATLDTLIENPDYLNVIAGGASPTCHVNNYPSGVRSDGSATAIATGGTGVLSYQWGLEAAGQTDVTAIELSAGTYSITVTDENNCKTTAIVDVVQPDELVILDTSYVQSTCGDANGSIEISPAGGEGSPYSVLWGSVGSNGQTNYLLDGIAAGVHCVTVVDGNTCVLEECYSFSTITGPTFGAVSASVNVSCFGEDDGSVCAEVATGGTLPYVYTWTSPISVDSALCVLKLKPETYLFCVEDANLCVECERPASIITEPDEITPILNTTDIACHGDCSGTASIKIVGGSSPYTIDWGTSLIEHVASVVTTTEIGLCANPYTVFITDDNGCMISRTDEVEQPTDPLVISSNVTEIDCNGDQTGVIAITHGGGTGAVTYSWSSNVRLKVFPYTTVGNLAAGTYTVTVADQNSCSIIESFTLGEPTALDLTMDFDSTHCSRSDGEAMAIVTGGTPTYHYNWSNGDTISSIDGLVTGSYQVTVTDDKGCLYNSEIEVHEVKPLTYTPTIIENSCYGVCDGEIAVVLARGSRDASGNYPAMHTWVGSAGNNGNLTASGLCGGAPSDGGAIEYKATFYDNEQCELEVSFYIESPEELVIYERFTEPQLCIGGSTQISATPDKGTFPYTFEWTHDSIATQSSGPHNVSPIVSTNYDVTITDLNGCTINTTFSVGVYEPLEVSLSPIATICLGDTVELFALANGGAGAPNYVFTWEKESGSPVVDIASSNTSTLTIVPTENIVIDVIVEDGCTVKASDEAEQQVKVVITPEAVFTPDSAGCSPLSLCFVNRTVMEATSYTFNFEPGASYTTTDVEDPDACYTFENGSIFNSRFVDVEMTATNDGCTSSATVQLEIYPLPSAAFDITPGVTTELNPSVQFTDLSSGASSVNYDFDGDGFLDAINVTDTLFVYQDTGTFVARQVVENIYGCIDETTEIVKIEGEYILYTANIFTPGDGNNLNNTFIPKGLGLENSVFNFYIFDRWGNLIFESTEYGDESTGGWDGTVQGMSGTIVQQDVYVWVIETTDHKGNPHKYIGHVTVAKLN
ncbi:MAG: gliding motility-associated C-terminal domain-containing protein, partial [Flavobacteriales bacterium]|nr:gliding motility-associated C-terminal domain-containing protein [Flavobacteriales bacterium]